MQHLCAVGLQGGKEAVDVSVTELREKHLLDTVLTELIASTYEERQQYRGNDAIIRVIEFIFEAMLPEIRNPMLLARTATATAGVSGTAAATASNALNRPQVEEDGGGERELVAAGELLRDLIKRCAGDAKKLRAEVMQRMR